MSIATYTVTGSKQAKSVSLPVVPKLSDETIVQVVRAVLANQDRLRPRTKTRAAVSGGGKKPWRQKGTGRARAGSNRSPLWRGGGITFGPSGAPRAYRRTTHTSRLLVWQAVLAQLADEDRLCVLTGKLAITKSKQAMALAQKMELPRVTLVVATPVELTGAIGFRNLAVTELTSTDDLVVADLLQARSVLLTEAALSQLTTRVSDRATKQTKSATQNQPSATKAAASKPKPTTPRSVQKGST